MKLSFKGVLKHGDSRAANIYEGGEREMERKKMVGRYVRLVTWSFTVTMVWCRVEDYKICFLGIGFTRAGKGQICKGRDGKRLSTLASEIAHYRRCEDWVWG